MNKQTSNRITTNEENDFEDVSSLNRLSRDKCATIAEDTLNKLKTGWCRSHGNRRINLEKDIRYSIDNSILYTEDDLENIKEIIPTSITTATCSSTKIEVRHCTTLQAAHSLVTETDEHRIGVLNFASAKNPEGGFQRGSNTQEESLARSSSLYLSISQNRFFSEFYGYNRRAKNGIYTHRIIYSPQVIVLKDDNGKLLSSPYHIGIVTVPAPNASIVQDPEAVRNAMKERIKRLLYVFEVNKHDTLVLGAFGCGVFKNDPLEVAMYFREHLESDEFKNSFKRIIFAIVHSEMYRIFERVFTATDLIDIQQEIGQISLQNSDNQYKQVHNNYYDQEDDD